MNNYLKVELDLFYDIDDGEEILCENIADIIREEEREFLELLVRICGTKNSRAEFLPDTLEVHKVVLSNQGGVASISFDYDAYNGCKDMDQGDTAEEEWKFKLDGKKILFRLLLPEFEREDEI